MEKIRKTVILLMVAAIPAAAPVFVVRPPTLCFTDGSVTYRLAPNARFADYAVAIDNRAPHPDLRFGLVDQVATADFALTDDAGEQAGNSCETAGILKTIRIVAAGRPADITISVSRDATAADFTLYVHSARVSHFDAAALFALMRSVANHRRVQDTTRAVAEFR
jgi:hypothetical protein